MIASTGKHAEERTRAEDAIRFQAGLLEAIDQAIIVVNLDGTVRYWNRSAEELYGWTTEETLGQALDSLIGAPDVNQAAGEILARLRAGESWSGEFHVRRKDGTVFPAHVTDSPIYDASGKLVGIVGVSCDLTDRNRAAEELARLAAIVRSSEDAIFAKSLDGVITAWNAGAERLYGYSAAEMIGQPAFCLAPAERTNEITGLLDRIARGEHVEHFETVRVRRDGQRVDVSVGVSPIRDVSGRVIGAATIARDITKQRRAERVRHEREAQLAESQRIAHVGSWELDLATQQVTWSDEHYRIFGLEPGGATLRPDVATAIHPDDQAAAHVAFERAVAERGSYAMELRVLRPDGSVRWIHNRCTFVAGADGGMGRMVGTAQDITERVESDRQQAQLAALMKSLLASTSEGIYGLDPDGRCTFINAAGAALLGYAPEELVGQLFHAQVHYQHVDGTPFPRETCPLLQTLRSGVAHQLDSDVVWRRDGTPLAVDFEANPLVEDGRTTGVVVAFRDLSARQRAEGSLRESEQRLRLALEIAGLGTWDLDLQHDRIVWSESHERMLGLEPGTFGGTAAAFQAFVHEDDLSIVTRGLEHSDGSDVEIRSEFRVRRVDGAIRWMATSGQVYRDSAGRPVRLLGVTRDVTERKQVEEQRESLQRSEKLRALGQMASGIAHDLNQSLMLVASYSDLARQALIQDPPNLAEVEDLLTTTTQAALDGGETVKRLLLFTRAAPARDTKRLDLSSVVREAAQLTAPRWRDAAQADGRPISLDVEAAGHPTIQGSEARLRELLTNLIFNAVDALPTGGTIRLRVLAEDGQGVVEITDSGVGMSAEVQARAFEPFFTTKGEGGTGLGLAMVFGIVEQHGGHIDVRSAPGNGTTFRMTFPLVETLAAAGPSPRASVQLEPWRPVRVLVVDDEPMMTRAVMRMLVPSGHVVSVAGSGEEALEKLAEQAFDVVVSDMGMGAGMNGWELAEAVKRRWPGVRFLLATGWGASIDPGEARDKGVEAVLSKPYQLVDLLHALARTDQAA